MKKVWAPLAFFLVLVALAVLVVYFGLGYIREHRSPDLLTVAYLDVGQGDAFLIESPDEKQVLIDGGRGAKVLRELPRVMGYFDRTIDVVIATHPDSDHIGGLIDVLKRYEVQTIVMTNTVNDTPAYAAFLHAVENEGATLVEAKRGQVFDLGRGPSGSTTLSILFPDRDVRNLESNMSSIITKLSYGDADFMFTADSPKNIETYLVQLDGTSLESEVLKVGHHGSRTSTDSEFLEMVQPLYGIISSGKDNDYGHPHKEVLDILREHNVLIKNTADVGSIIMESDGKTIWFK